MHFNKPSYANATIDPNASNGLGDALSDFTVVALKDKEAMPADQKESSSDKGVDEDKHTKGFCRVS